MLEHCKVVLLQVRTCNLTCFLGNSDPIENPMQSTLRTPHLTSIIQSHQAISVPTSALRLQNHLPFDGNHCTRTRNLGTTRRL